MNKLTVQVQDFLNISIEDCLNYTPHEKLENTIKSSTESLIKKITNDMDNTLSEEDLIEYFLQQILLRISAHDKWISLRDKHNLDQDYLYTVIKKHVYLYAPEFLQ
ncbi:hypothetical protein UT300018_27700 [Clostridium faecium]|uniref:Uncharacterized protein n=1 Tax=Clostridium faecium TaxID=2762223 RepID=A0ABR8YUP8_9CLOT|nr:hypothetical protein [Clostridium faecium]MBD8047971.1 hypothetical protein [Clostridium faecium]